MWLLALLGCPGEDGKETGDPAPPSLAEADFAVRGSAGDMAGSAVAAADLDGDGVDGLVVGALGGRLACPVAAGADGTLAAAGCLTEAQPYDFLGQAVAAADLDGDGRDALVLGAPGADVTVGADGPTHPDAGAVWLVSDAPAASTAVSEVGAEWTGEEAGDGAGSFVAAGGDADGDGLGDVLVGAPGSDRGAAEGGALYLVDGAPGALGAAPFVVLGGASPSPAKHAGDVLGDGVGIAGCVGDLDGDGRDDLAAGAPGWDGGRVDGGAVALFLGPVTPGAWALSDADVLLEADRGGGYAGGALACGGDTDGDGAAELLVGADADQGGRVYVWRGGALGDGPVVSAEAGEQLGYAVAFVPGGLAVSLPSDDTAATDAGGVAVFLAPGAGTLGLADADARWTGVAAGDLAGVALAAFVGPDGPGLAIGAPYDSAEEPIGGAVYGVSAP